MPHFSQSLGVGHHRKGAALGAVVLFSHCQPQRRLQLKGWQLAALPAAEGVNPLLPKKVLGGPAQCLSQVR